MQRCFVLLIWVAFVVSPALSFAQENISMITYGPGAMTAQGDDDFRQMIFFRVPRTVSDSLYLRIFDADCGGDLDSPFGPFDTETRFQLFGGAGAYSAPTVKNPYPKEEDMTSGLLIASEVFRVNPFQDSKWYNFAYFLPVEGEEIGGDYVFRLVVEGLSGNDGNVFEVVFSLDDKRNVPPEGLEMFGYAPTIRLPRTGVFAEMRFFVPDSVDGITVHNFDLSGAKLEIETAFRSNLPVASSGQDEWDESQVQFENKERNRLNALIFEGGEEMPNDATFYLTDEQDRTMPVQLPMYARTTNRRPIPQVDTETLSDCHTIIFDGSRSTDEDGEALEFFWDFGDGQTGKGVRIVHRYDRLGRYEAELIVSDVSGQVGNSSLQRFTVVVNQPPHAEAGPDVVGEPGQTLAFDGSASRDPDGEIKRYTWDFGDGSRGEGISLSHVFRKLGRYTVSLRVEDDSESPCNYDVDQLKVWINAAPVVEIGEDRISSPGDSITFDGSLSYDSDGEIASHLWNFGDGSEKAGKTVQHAYERPGKYQVTLTIKDDTDVANNIASDQFIVTVNDRPVPEAGDDRRAAANEIVHFDGSGSIDRDGEIIDYFWEFGDGATAKGKKVSHPYSRSGEYRVALTVQDSSTSTSDKAKDSLTVIVNSPPVAVAGRDTVVTSSEVRFDGTHSSDEDGEIIAYLWSFGDGTRSSDPSPLHVYRSPGTYTVKLTVTDDSGTSTRQTSDELAIIVNEVPIADAGVDQIGAPGQSLAFDGSESLDPDGHISDYAWDFGDGTTGSGPEVSHTYEDPGIYMVRLTVRDNTGHTRSVDHDEVVVSINASPIADAGRDAFAAPNQTIVFNGGGSYDLDGKIASYEWRFSDGRGTDEAIEPKRAFSRPGVYSATLTVTDNSGAINARTQDKISIYINHEPEAKPGKDIITCDATVLFDGSASADADGHPLAYTWDFGDGTPPDTGLTVIHTYSRSGIYPAVLTVDDGTGLANARHSASITVTINQPPVAKAGKDRVICAGDVVLFDGGGSVDPEGGLLKYAWDFGDGTTAEGLNPTKVYKNGGVYQVTLTVKDDSDLLCNSHVDQIVVRVAESPVANAGLDQTVCANTVVQFDGSESRDFDGVVNNFSWDFGDGSTGGGATPTHVYTSSGTYRVLLTITGDQIGECDNTDKDEMAVTVTGAPTAKFTYDKTVAVNTPVEFDASESSSEGDEIVSWEWNFGDGTSAEGETITHTYSVAGRYFVRLTVKTDSETGCNATSIQDFVIVNGAPIANAGEDQFVGKDQVVTFNGSGSKDLDGAIVSYIWDFGDGETASGVVVRHQYRTSGLFTVVLSVTDDTDLENNSDADTVQVTVNETPVSVIDGVDWACVGQEIQFSGHKSTDPDGSIAGYLWDFGDGQTADNAQVSHTYNASGRYEVTLTVDDGSSMTNSKSTTAKTVMINYPPMADAGPDQIVCPGAVVTFDASASTDRDGEIISYGWDFGDGTNDEGKHITHVYENPGRYEVRLNVTDHSGTPCGTGEDAAMVIVNSPPVAEAGPDQETFFRGAHDAALFDGTKSYDPDGDPLTYFWDFGDGTSETGAKARHTYIKPGEYVVRLRVRDSSGTPCGEVWDELTVQVIERKSASSEK